MIDLQLIRKEYEEETKRQFDFLVKLEVERRLGRIITLELEIDREKKSLEQFAAKPEEWMSIHSNPERIREDYARLMRERKE